jgi:hypothetical protein
MNIIEQSKAEALRKDNNTRMNNAVKNIDFYYNNQYEYTKEEMQKRYPATFKDIYNYIITVPLTKSLILQLAKIFQRDPEIKPDTDNQNIKDAISIVFDQANLFGKLKIIDRFTELCGKIGVIPIWNPITKKVGLDILTPDRCIVITDDNFPDTPIKVMYRINTQSNNLLPARTDIWAIWTTETYTEATLKTNYEIDKIIKEPIPNPYGKIPIAWFELDYPLNCFWNEEYNSIVPQNLRTNIQLTNLDLALDYQSFATLCTEGFPDNRELIIGLTRHINIPRDPVSGEAGGKIYYINPNVDLRQIWEIINQNIDFTASLLGLSTSAVKQSSTFSSGYQLKLSMQGVIDHNEDKRSIYIESLRQLTNLICQCENYYGSQRLPEDIDFNIKFNDIAIAANPIEEEQIISMRLTNGTMDRAEAIMKHNPDMTREEAEQRVSEIDASKKQTLNSTTFAPGIFE